MQHFFVRKSHLRTFSCQIRLSNRSVTNVEWTNVTIAVFKCYLASVTKTVKARNHQQLLVNI